MDFKKSRLLRIIKISVFYARRTGSPLTPQCAVMLYIILYYIIGLTAKIPPPQNCQISPPPTGGKFWKNFKNKNHNQIAPITVGKKTEKSKKVLSIIVYIHIFLTQNFQKQKSQSNCAYNSG